MYVASESAILEMTFFTLILTLIGKILRMFDGHDSVCCIMLIYVYVLTYSMHTTCIQHCVNYIYICWLLPSNQSFYRLIAG